MASSLASLSLRNSSRAWASTAAASSRCLCLSVSSSSSRVWRRVAALTGFEPQLNNSLETEKPVLKSEAREENDPSESRDLNHLVTLVQEARQRDAAHLGDCNHRHRQDPQQFPT